MFDRIKALIEKWQDLKEIDAMSDRDLDDLGMSRSQVRRFAQMPGDIGERVTHMAAIFGISEADLKRDYPAYIELLESCGDCTTRKECSHILALGDAATPGQCSFCRNARAFSEAVL